MSGIKIDLTFREVIPPLTDKELKTLEKSIIFEGCREPIIVWNGLIIDGHNRFDICTKNNIPYETIKMNFASKRDALSWMIDNQLGRRNLNDAQKIELVLKREEIIGTNVGTSPIERNFPSLTRDKQEAIAKETGTSKGNVSKVKRVLEKATPEVKDKMRKGEISINKAEKTTKPEPEPKATPEGLIECPVCGGTGTVEEPKFIPIGTCKKCGGELNPKNKKCPVHGAQ